MSADPVPHLAVADLPPLAFVGGGHMAASLIGGLIGAGLPAARIRVAQRNRERADQLRARFAVEIVDDAGAAVAGRALLVLAVKPQQMQDALRELRPAAGATVLSVAAGVRVASLARALPGCAIVRSMPNTPALFGVGISGVYAPEGTPPLARAQVQALLASAGEVCWVDDEAQMDAVTALSGCGPAYYFLLTEALREAGAALGLDAGTAARLAQQTLIGAAAMARGSTTDVAELRRQVTSKGGSTEAALDVLESAGLRRIFRQALAAADARARLRGDELEAGLSSS